MGIGVSRSGLASLFFIALLTGHAEGQPVTEIVLKAGGIVQVGSTDYTDVGPLKVRLQELKAKSPPKNFQVTIQKNLPFSDAAQALVLLQNSGEIKIGFVTGQPTK